MTAVHACADPSARYPGLADDLLRSLGIVPTLAEDGAEAVALAGARTFDLILMDLHMPVLDGLAATNLILAADGAAT